MKIRMPMLGAALAAMLSIPVHAQTPSAQTPSATAGSAASQAAASADLAASIASDPFVKLDKNHDGVISKDEADRKLLKAWAKFDTNHDGKIDSAEYAAGAN